MVSIGDTGLLAVDDPAVGTLHEAFAPGGNCSRAGLDHDRLLLAALLGVEVVADVDSQLAAQMLPEVVCEESDDLPDQVLVPLVAQGEHQVVGFARHVNDQQLCGKTKEKM